MSGLICKGCYSLGTACGSCSKCDAQRLQLRLLDFPILGYQHVKGCPATIPWALIAPHERQARQNHGGQSLRQLAERGGLSPVEIYWVMTKHEIMSLKKHQYAIIGAIAADFIHEEIEKFQATQGVKP